MRHDTETWPWASNGGVLYCNVIKGWERRGGKRWCVLGAGVNKNINCLQDFFSSDKLTKKGHDIKFWKYDSLFSFDNFIVKICFIWPSNKCSLSCFCYIFNLYARFPWVNQLTLKYWIFLSSYFGQIGSLLTNVIRIIKKNAPTHLNFGLSPAIFKILFDQQIHMANLFHMPPWEAMYHVWGMRN